MKSEKQTIFGYSESDIMAMQQGKSVARPLDKLNVLNAKKKIEHDMKKFQIPVSREVKEAYKIEMPDNYYFDEKSDNYIFDPYYNDSVYGKNANK